MWKSNLKSSKNCIHCGFPLTNQSSEWKEQAEKLEPETAHHTKTSSDVPNDCFVVENSKKTIPKWLWVIIVDIIVCAIGLWWFYADLGVVDPIISIGLIVVVSVVSFFIYIYAIDDTGPTFEESKRINDAIKYNNYQFTCPQCGSKKVKRIGNLERGTSVYLVGLASGKIGKQYHCDNCKHNW